MDQNSNMRKSCRTFFPMGFGVGKIENEIIVLNFLDIVDSENEIYEIISSIAMSRDKAKSLIESLKDAIGGDEDDSK